MKNLQELNQWRKNWSESSAEQTTDASFEQERIVMLLDTVHEKGLGLPKCDDERYEGGFFDVMNYFIQEMKKNVESG